MQNDYRYVDQWPLIDVYQRCPVSSYEGLPPNPMPAFVPHNQTVIDIYPGEDTLNWRNNCTRALACPALPWRAPPRPVFPGSTLVCPALRRAERRKWSPPPLATGKFGPLPVFNGTETLACEWQSWSMALPVGMELEAMDVIYQQVGLVAV